MVEDSKRFFLEYLRQIYDQANEHLREQEHKRDQLITFYAVLVSFFITTNGAITKNFGGMITNVFLNIGLFVIGFAICTTIAGLRGWHSQYLDVIYVINFVIAREELYETVKDLKNTIQNKVVEDQTEGSKKTLGSFVSTENIMFFGMVIFSLTPVLMFGHASYDYAIKVNMIHEDKQTIATFFWVVFAVFSSGYIIYMRKFLISKISNSNTYKTWMLDFDYYSNGAPNHDYYDVMQSHGILSLKQNTAGVVTVPKKGTKYLLIKVGRLDGKYHWEFPRGFVEKQEIDSDGTIHYEQAAKRELSEELNIDSSKISRLEDLGEVQPDSGLINSSIHIVGVEIADLENIVLQNSEKIQDWQLVSKAELMNLCSSNEIVDGFTLSAITVASK